MGRSKSSPGYSPEKLFEWFSFRAGKFMFFTTAAAFVYGAAYSEVFGLGYRESPFPLNILVLVGLVMLVVSFIGSSRSRRGRWPTMPMVGFAYLFATTIVAVLITRMDKAPYLPSPPDWVLHGDRAALYWMIFVMGWILGYGSSRGWNRRQTDPWPFRFIFRKMPLPKSGEPEEEPR